MLAQEVRTNINKQISMLCMSVTPGANYLLFNWNLRRRSEGKRAVRKGRYCFNSGKIDSSKGCWKLVSEIRLFTLKLSKVWSPPGGNGKYVFVLDLVVFGNSCGNINKVVVGYDIGNEFRKRVRWCRRIQEWEVFVFGWEWQQQNMNIKLGKRLVMKAFT